MVAVLAGLVLIIAAVVLWLGSLTLGHAVAILLAVTGLLLVLWYAGPNGWYSRRRA